MFAISVNGCNFWEEFNKKYGKQITVTINPKQDNKNPKQDDKKTPDDTDSLVSELDWTDGGGKILLKEERKISVQKESDVTLLDWVTTLKTQDQKAILDKSNHHYFGLGMRFVESMDKSGQFFTDNEKNKFDIVRTDDRLTLCRWVAYRAKLGDAPVTVAIFGHKENPIPTMAFTKGESRSYAYLGITLNLHRKPVEMKPNSSLTFRYRVAVWDGEVKPETIENAFLKYAQR
jgi:hypothetical protein